MKKLALAVAAACVFPWSAGAQDVLTMELYLEQVRLDNKTYQGSIQNRDGADDRAAEADLVTSFRLSGQLQYEKDQSIPITPIITYESLNTTSSSLGIEKPTTFGLSAKLSYDISSLRYTNSNIGAIGGQESITTASPTIKLTQSLWQNGFGNLTKAIIESKMAQATADRFTSQASVDSTIQNSISAYWSLVLSREVVSIRSLSVQQAQSVYDYNSKRAKMNLGEEADIFTAKASLETTKLDLQLAIDNEETARRVFNQYRNRPPMEDPGKLLGVDWNALTQFKLPDEHSDRADVKSAKYQADANAANSRIQIENDQPVLDAYGSYSLNGRANEFGSSLSNSYSPNHPTAIVGVNLSMPLDFEALKRARRGAKAQANAAALIYQQKALDQEADWQDIKSKVLATQRRVVLATAIEDAQKTKLEFEKKRLRSGRTSTYQILLYEQDYTSARLTRVQTASEMISLLSRARLYAAKEEGSTK